MKIVRPTTLAGLVLVAAALPVTAYALSSADAPGPTATSQQAKGDTPDDPETEAPETEAPDTEAPDPTDTADDSATEPTQPETSGQPNPASAPGRAHALAMQAWAHCVGQAASGPKTPGQPMPPKLACGAKPLAPGQLKHQSATAPGTTTIPKGAPGSHGHGHAHGHAKGR